MGLIVISIEDPKPGKKDDDRIVVAHWSKAKELFQG